jgi:hypothetical protein
MRTFVYRFYKEAQMANQNQQINPSDSTSSAMDTSSDPFHGFHQIADGLTEALNQFKKLNSSEGVTALLDALKPLNQYGKRAVDVTVDYTRRHPVRIAITVAALGFVFASLVKPAAKKAAQTLH